MRSVNWGAVVIVFVLFPFIVIGYGAGLTFYGLLVGWRGAQNLVDWILA